MAIRRIVSFLHWIVVTKNDPVIHRALYIWMLQKLLNYSSFSFLCYAAFAKQLWRQGWISLLHTFLNSLIIIMNWNFSWICDYFVLSRSTMKIQCIHRGCMTPYMSSVRSVEHLVMGVTVLSDPLLKYKHISHILQSFLRNTWNCTKDV